jgi:hypothetical protein
MMHRLKWSRLNSANRNHGYQVGVMYVFRKNNHRPDFDHFRGVVAGIIAHDDGAGG